MSKIIRSAKHLLSPEKKPNATLYDEGEEEARDQGSRMNSDICVPRLGHSTGYAHEILPPTTVNPSPLTQTAQTPPSASASPVDAADRSPRAETVSTLPQTSPKTRAVSPFKRKLHILGKGERTGQEQGDATHSGRADVIEKRATG